MEAGRNILIGIGIIGALALLWWLTGGASCDAMYRAGRDCMG